MSWYYGLFLYGGVVVKMAMDYFDKQLPINRKVVGTWILGAICASIFYVAVGVTDYYSNAHTSKSLLIYLLFSASIGYLATHFFLKITNFVDKKSDQTLKVTQTTTVEKTGTPDATTKN